MFVFKLPVIQLFVKSVPTKLSKVTFKSQVWTHLFNWITLSQIKYFTWQCEHALSLEVNDYLFVDYTKLYYLLYDYLNYRLAGC